MVEGLAPAEFKQAVLVQLQHEKSWKSDPYLVMDTVVAEAQVWRRVEVFGKSSTSSPRSSSSRNRGSKSAGSAASNITCFQCGQVSHIVRKCPTPSEGESGQTSAARPHNHKRRGSR
ncbi:unnamed protein product, partial [Sphacelaria rigidula]